MPRRRSSSRRFALIVLLVPLAALAQDHPQISEDEIKRYFGQATGCNEVDVGTLAYHDFTGSRQDEAVVVAFTCATGTAGPDVHSVVSRGRDGSLVELKIPELTEKQQAVLFCRCFYDLSIDDGLLVATYQDQSGRKDPLVLKYLWNAKAGQFEVADVKAPPRHKASFDCEKAQTVVENAICESQENAQLDVTPNARYRSWLDHLNNADSDILEKEQKDWLRKRNLVCADDPEIMDCLAIMYRARILELEHFKALHP
jgi:uncharacterized protein YecT (DUF1311 family)